MDAWLGTCTCPCAPVTVMYCVPAARLPVGWCTLAQPAGPQATRLTARCCCCRSPRRLVISSRSGTSSFPKQTQTPHCSEARRRHSPLQMWRGALQRLIIINRQILSFLPAAPDFQQGPWLPPFLGLHPAGGLAQEDGVQLSLAPSFCCPASPRHALLIFRSTGNSHHLELEVQPLQLASQ